MYDLLAWHQNIPSSYLISRTKALAAFPMITRSVQWSTTPRRAPSSPSEKKGLSTSREHSPTRSWCSTTLEQTYRPVIVGRGCHAPQLLFTVQRRPAQSGTSDGPVIFSLPWQGNTLAVTTKAARGGHPLDCGGQALPLARYSGPPRRHN